MDFIDFHEISPRFSGPRGFFLDFFGVPLVNHNFLPFRRGRMSAWGNFCFFGKLEVRRGQLQHFFRIIENGIERNAKSLGGKGGVHLPHIEPYMTPRKTTYWLFGPIETSAVLSQIKVKSWELESWELRAESESWDTPGIAFGRFPSIPFGSWGESSVLKGKLHRGRDARFRTPHSLPTWMLLPGLRSVPEISLER